MSLILNRDLLTAIVKQLLEDGDQNAVIQYGLSGKQPLQALVNVFASITNLELYDDYYAIGLDGRKCCIFYYKDEETNTTKDKNQHSRSLMLCIGDSVTNLRMDCGKEASLKYYQPFLDKIIAKKQLSTLSVPRCYSQIDAMKLIQTFSSTLTDVAINRLLLNDSIRDSLKLEKLTILQNNDIFFFQFCPQTSILNFMHPDDLWCNRCFHNSFCKFFSAFSDQASIFLPSVKELIFNDGVGTAKELFEDVSFNRYKLVFPSLEHVKFNMKHDNTYAFTFRFSRIKDDIYHLKNAIRDATNVPSKITYFIQNPSLDDNYDFSGTHFLDREPFTEFEMDSTVENVYCFRQMIESAEQKLTVIEIHLAKK